MAETIKDGTGNEYQVKVDSINRIHTNSLTISENLNKTIDGDAYTVGTTTPISLTSDTPSAAFFCKNNGTEDIVVRKIFILFDGNVGGTGTTGVGVVRNPVSISPEGPTGGLLTNSNFGSSKEVDITAIDGADGATFESNNIWNFYNTSDEYFTSEESFVLPKGASFGALVFPPSGNTSLNINIGFSFYVK